jgi:hypothetical protein
MQDMEKKLEENRNRIQQLEQELEALKSQKEREEETEPETERFVIKTALVVLQGPML